MEAKLQPSLVETVPKHNPHTGTILTNLARSQQEDVDKAVEAAQAAFEAWADTPAVQRGLLLHKMIVQMQERQEEIAEIVALETGKSFQSALW